MKNLVLVLVSLLFVVFVQAQSNEQTTVQTGDENHATVNQIGADNTSSITQTEIATNSPVGTRTATVNQNGTENESVVEQTESGGGNHGALNSTLNQIGFGNYAYQRENAPGSNSGQNETAYQEGDDNNATQNINGGYTNSFGLIQEGDDNTSDQYMHANHSHGRVEQYGDGNNSQQHITGSNHGYSGGAIFTGQYGNNNSAKQTLSGSGLGHVQNAYIYQTGDMNVAEQNASGKDFKLTITQTGNQNTGRQYAYGNDNEATLEQLGNNNDGNVSYNPTITYQGQDYDNVQPYFDPFYNQYQDGNNNSEIMGIEGNFNHTAQYQDGDFNNAIMKIWGDYNNSAQEQTGDFNTSTINIYGGIQGNGNYAMTEQHSTATSTSEGNIAIINQGNENLDVIGNCAGIEQDGHSMYGIIEQYGDYNWARGIQLGNSHSMEVLQQGNSNFANINQSNL